MRRGFVPSSFFHVGVDMTQKKEGRYSTTTHDGFDYKIDDLIDHIKDKSTIQLNLNELKWAMDGVVPDAKRVDRSVVDSYPIIVTRFRDGRYVTLDGFHRALKAVKEGRVSIEAYPVTEDELETLPRTVSFKLYHISNQLYADLRPLTLQSGGKAKIEEMKSKGYKSVNTYKKEINFFFNPIDTSHVKRLIGQGFSRWKHPRLYLYTVNVGSELFTKNYNYFSVSSTPQELAYNDKYWDGFWRENRNADNWDELKAKWLADRERYLHVRHGIKPRMSREELMSHGLLQDWQDLEKHLNINIAKGNRNQYASCIPHIQLSVNEPIAFESIRLIDENKGMQRTQSSTFLNW